MLIQKKTIIGMVLCTLVFSASVPILMGVKSSPETMFKGEDIIVLSQTDVGAALEVSLAHDLQEQEFIDAVSPETYGFCYVKVKDEDAYEPVFIRGVEFENFLKLENAELSKGSIENQDCFLMLGESLGDRIGYQVGDFITLTGSVKPAILELTVSGIFSSDMPSNNEILISLRDVAKLAGISRENVLTIRVKTDDRDQLIEYLKEEEYSVVVGTGGSNPIVINENRTYEQSVAESLAIKYAEPEEFQTTNESFVSTFIQEGTNTIGAVIIGFIGLNAILTFIGITAILARGVIERRKDIGILAAIGADKKTIYLLLLKDLLIISVIASGIGVILGFMCAQIVENMGLIVAFGHVITPESNLTLFFITFVIAVIIGCASGLFVSSVTLSAEPRQLIMEIEDTLEDSEVESLPKAVGV